MGKLRTHDSVVIDNFNGLWQRGDTDNTPIDHFAECNNLKFVGTSAFRTRYGLGISQDVAVPLGNVKRIYNYPTQTGNTLIVLVINEDDEGEIYHVVDETTTFGPLLTIEDMTDFAFVPFNGRAYISPFTTFDVGGLNVEKGLQNEFVYVYAGDGTPARVAGGGAPMSGALVVANGAAGNTDAGFHLFAFVKETISGALSAPGQITGFTTASNLSVSFSGVQATGDPTVARRHLVATKVIPSYDGNTTGYQFFFVPNATINDDITTTLNNISFFYADLLDDASHLLDNYPTIPAGAVLSNYHERMTVSTLFDDISITLVSAAGEPEAISQIDGLLVFPPDGNPVTNAQELRDVFYLFKRARTVSFTDNGDVPSTWPLVLVDNALGTSVHGVATVLDSGSSSVDNLIVCTYQGVTLFNGRYIQPELSYKIQAFWQLLDRNDFRFIQLVNAPIQQEIYIVLPNRTGLVAYYANGMDPKKIKWTPISILPGMNTIAIYNIDEIIIGADLP